METEHTKGPWESGLDADGDLCVVTHEARDICTVEKHFGDHEANARLIAAAPELLKACKRLVSSLEYWYPRHGDPEATNSSMMNMARAAIAKAESQE